MPQFLCADHAAHQGHFALVDDADYASVTRYSGPVYAIRSICDEYGRWSDEYVRRTVAGALAGYEVVHLNGDTLNNRGQCRCRRLPGHAGHSDAEGTVVIVADTTATLAVARGGGTVSSLPHAPSQQHYAIRSQHSGSNRSNNGDDHGCYGFPM